MAAQRAPRLFSVEVNPKFCKGCEICVQVCPKDVLVMSERAKAEAVNVEACSGCMNCEIYCPDFAIAVKEVPVHA